MLARMFHFHKQELRSVSIVVGSVCLREYVGKNDLPFDIAKFFTIHHCVDRDVFKALSLLFIALPLCWQGVVKVTGITLITLRCRVLSSCGSGSSCNRSKHLPIFLCCTPKGTRQIIKQIITITIMITSSIMKTWSVWTLNWQGSWYTSCGWCQARRVT